MKKILIIEDDACTRMIYRTKLQAEGFVIEAVADGRAGIGQLTANPPDLVLLDLMLPHVSGIEVLKFIRSHERTKNLPTIVLANAYEYSITEAARKAGANLCLCKTNCTPANLVQEVRTMLAAPVESGRALDQGAAEIVTEADSSSTLAEIGTTEQIRQRAIELRHAFQKLGQSNEALRSNHLIELRRAVHGIAGGAALAGLTHLARLSCALEALLNELHARPQNLNPSSLRTAAQAIDLLAALIENPEGMQGQDGAAPKILVVDDEPISRQTVCAALKKAGLPATALADPVEASKLVAHTRFDLIFLDVEMPGMNGFDVCTKLHATIANATTPVVFVTTLTGFEARARSNLSGGTDIIAKPVSLGELAVKALIHLYRSRMKLATTQTNSAKLAGIPEASHAGSQMAAAR